MPQLDFNFLFYINIFVNIFIYLIISIGFIILTLILLMFNILNFKYALFNILKFDYWNNLYFIIYDSIKLYITIYIKNISRFYINASIFINIL